MRRRDDDPRQDLIRIELLDQEITYCLFNVAGLTFFSLYIDYDDRLRLYNVDDILPPEAYFYEHDLFPLANCKVDSKSKGRPSWEIDDDLKLADYCKLFTSNIFRLPFIET